ncbi:MAG: PilT/PilU family type 4a pilus ATPase [Planctomycetota bacterium]
MQDNARPLDPNAFPKRLKLDSADEGAPPSEPQDDGPVYVRYDDEDESAPRSAASYPEPQTIPLDVEESSAPPQPEPAAYAEPEPAEAYGEAEAYQEPEAALPESEAPTDAEPYEPQSYGVDHADDEDSDLLYGAAVEDDDLLAEFQEQTPAPDLSAGASPALSNTQLSPRHKLEAWLAEMVRLQASDLILRAGGKPSCRVDGRIHFLPGRVPATGPLLEVLEGVMGPDRMETWKQHGSVDTALQLDGLGRFRVNAYKQMGEPALVLRRIQDDPPLLSTLCLPTVHLEQLAMRKRGIVLVTGVAGSGKSTTLSAMIQYMNSHAERHVITLEDPVEMIFTEDRCVISQRETGTDCQDFQDGLRHALRQSPDVILIGEMRDAETVSAALDATETGHLVFSTLHTVNAPQTVDRILSFFKSEQHTQVRQRLADNLAAVLSQRLVPRRSGTGMVPAIELMLSTPRVRELLYEGRTKELARVIDSGEEELISFNQSLRTLVHHDLVDLDVALAASDRPEELLLALRGFSQGSQAQRRGPLRMAGRPGE